MSNVQDLKKLARSLRDAANAVVVRREKAQNVRTPQYITPTLRRDIRDLVAYNWADEEEDFKTSTEENGPQPGHIFHVLKRLNALVK